MSAHGGAACPDVAEQTLTPHPVPTPRPEADVTADLAPLAAFGMLDLMVAPGVPMRALAERLLALRGGMILPDGQMPYVAEMVTRGVAYGASDVLLPGEARLCHRNSLLAWYARPDTLTLVTGFAFIDELGLWVHHTWLVDDAGLVHETTAPRDVYFGVPLTDDESEAWIDLWTE